METPAPRRVLRRSTEDCYVLGVCGGLGRYLERDPGWFRVVFVILAPAGGALAYLLLAAALPAERPGDELGPPTPRMRGRTELRERYGGGLGAAVGAVLRRRVLRRS